MGVKGLLRIDRAELGKIISTTTDDSDDSDDVVMGLIPVGIEKSHEGISLSTLSVIGMSRSDQQRLFTIMLRESDSETIRGNGASQTIFTRGALSYTELLNANDPSSNSKMSGIDSSEHEENNILRMDLTINNNIKNQK